MIPQAENNDWERLIGYYISCLQQEDSFEELLQRSSQGARYVFSNANTDNLFVNPEEGIRVNNKIANILDAARLRGDALFYGYPVVLVHESTGNQNRRKLGCLLTIELGEIPRAGEPSPERLYPKTDDPFFHPTLLARLGIKSEQQLVLAKEFKPEDAAGSASFLRDYFAELVEVLELPVITPADPSTSCPYDEGTIEGVGGHNVAIIFRGTNSVYNRRLLEELKDIKCRGTEVKNSAASYLLATTPNSPSNRSDSDSSIVCPIACNDSQYDAIESATVNPLTVITGPPGTGKSQLITNLIATAWASKQTILVVSTNNQAVDVACSRAQNIYPGLIIRTGSRENRKKAKETLSKLINDLDSLPDRSALQTALKANQRLYKELRTSLDKRTQAEIRLAEVILGQESLYSSCSWPDENQRAALDTKKTVKKKLRQVKRTANARFFRQWRMKRLSSSLGIELGKYASIVEKFLQLQIERLELFSVINNLPETNQIVRSLAESDHEQQRLSSKFVLAIAASAVTKGRSTISRFIQARAIYGHNPIPEMFPSLLQHLPAWASTALSTGATIPLKPALFDLVVIDEASQCSIPQIIPALFRAKRAVVIGDPQQLAHISNITKADESSKILEAGLDENDIKNQKLIYSKNSIYHAMEKNVGQPFLLDEHYRSHPQIIGLSNRLFYDGRLTILTNPENLYDFGTQAVAWKNVTGVAKRPDSGSAINIEEAEATAEAIVRLAKSGRPVSIGAVTPFSAQSNIIQNLIEQTLSSEDRERTSITVGTAHRFQGDERDVIIFSPVASDGVPDKTLAWLSGTPNLFNVAVTRARSYLLIVGNQHFCTRNGGLLGELAKYVEELKIRNDVLEAGGRGQLHSEAEVRLYEAMLRANIEVRPKVLVRGYECDFVIEKGDTAINIECDGRHHLNNFGRQRLQDRYRDALIQNQGWRVLRVPAWKCIFDPDSAVIEIKEYLKEITGER